MVIYIRNLSKRVSPDDGHVMSEACHQHIAQVFAPRFAMVAPNITYIGSSEAPPKSNVLTLLDDPPAGDEGVEGYHDLSASGLIEGDVFASPSLDNGAKVLDGPNSVASVLDHELKEALKDPWANYWIDTYGKLVLDGREYAQVADEECDPVEADEGVGISVLGKAVSLSNFILPEWSNPNFDGPVDYLTELHPDRPGALTKPFARSEGGYVIVRNHIGQEVAKFGSRYPEWRKVLKHRKLSRTRRRGALVA